jgi:hypothetical protein
VSLKTGRCSELRADHEVRYTGNERFWVNTISKISAVTYGFYGFVVRAFGPKIRQEFPSA